MKQLTEEAQLDRDDYERALDDTSCYCQFCPPCGMCTHPGHPLNQEVDDCWEEVPDEVEEVATDIMSITRSMVA